MVWYLCNTRENTSSHHWRRLVEASIRLSRWLRMVRTVRISLIRSMPSCDSWSLRTVNSCEITSSAVVVRSSPLLIPVSSMDSSMNSWEPGMSRRGNNYKNTSDTLRGCSIFYLLFYDREKNYLPLWWWLQMRSLWMSRKNGSMFIELVRMGIIPPYCSRRTADNLSLCMWSLEWGWISWMIRSVRSRWVSIQWRERYDDGG